jgi:UDP-3-O-acyl-N-acetylglucosamine deacetylase
VLGHVRSVRGGHELNNLALRALFDRPEAWRCEDMTERTPGATTGAAALQVAG